MLEVENKQPSQLRASQPGHDVWTQLMETIQMAVTTEIDANIEQIERHRADRNELQLAGIRF